MKLAAVLLLLGCSKYDSDWSGKPLEPQTVSIGGTSVTLNVPKGLPRDAKDLAGTWSVTKVEGDFIPKIFVRFDSGMHEDVDGFARWVLLNKQSTLVRKETRPDGFAITDAPKNKHRIEAVRLMKVGDKQLQCTAVQVGDSEVPSYAKTRAMLESICDSMTVSGAEPTK